MNRADILSFARRDWASVAEAKARYWADRKRGMTAEQALAVGEMLRRHALQVKPGWPDPAARAADLDAHIRLLEALRAVSPRRPR